MRKILSFTILLLMPLSAAAQKVAVVPASYVRAETGAESKDAAAKVTARVLEGVKDAGKELSDETAVKNAIVQVTGKEDGVCQDKECLTRLSDLLYTDEAVFVKVVEKSEAEREVVLVLARGEAATEISEDGFMVVLEKIRRKVALALQKSEPRTEGTTADAEPEPEPVEEPEKATPKKGISPIAFYISAGVTSALAISLAVIEPVGLSRKKDLEKRPWDDKWDDDQASLKNLQIADRVLWGAAAAGAVTTTVLFFLTEFDKERRGEASLAPREASRAPRIQPAVTPNGGALMIEGRF